MNYRKHAFTIGIRLLIIINLTVVGLYLVSPVFLKNKIVEKAAKNGLDLTIESTNYGLGKFTLHGVNASDGSINFSISSIQLVEKSLWNPFTFKTVIIEGGGVLIDGTLQDIQNKWEKWKSDHPSKESKEKINFEASNLSIKWMNICDGDDLLIRGLSLNNNPDWNFTTKEINASCRQYLLHAEELVGNKSKIETKSADLVGPGIHINTHMAKVASYFQSTKSISAQANDAYLEISNIPKIIMGNVGLRINLQDTENDIHFDFAITSDKTEGKYESITNDKIESGPIKIEASGSLSLNGTNINSVIIPKDINGNPSGEFKIKDTQILFSINTNNSSTGLFFVIPKTSCQDLLDDIPDGMNNTIQGLKLDGEAGANLEITKSHNVNVRFDYHNECKVVAPPFTNSRSELRSIFTRSIVDPSGAEVEVKTGPKDPKWIPYSHISKFLIGAIQTTEDLGFFNHHGFDRGAIENSIKEDIESNKFIRGASTITMQLAKNLWLSREKTLSRKLQEAFLTIYLEQTLSKQEILETYFNVVELGPMIYGIGEASEYYFKTEPEDLTLSQSLFLTSILPNPKVNWFDSDGKLQAGRMKYLQILMKRMLDRNLISQQEYDRGLAEVVSREK